MKLLLSGNIPIQLFKEVKVMDIVQLNKDNIPVYPKTHLKAVENLLNVTTAKDGLMRKEDKIKLDLLASTPNEWYSVEQSRFGFNWITDVDNPVKMYQFTNKRAYLKGRVKSGATSVGTRILTVRADYKPLEETIFAGFDGTKVVLLRMDINGNIYVETQPSTADIIILGEFSYRLA